MDTITHLFLSAGLILGIVERLEIIFLSSKDNFTALTICNTVCTFIDQSLILFGFIDMHAGVAMCNRCSKLSCVEVFSFE